jgi:predicted Zn-dependent protease
MINAFAAPGGTIIVMRGLLEQTKNPEELAGVLAHEMQHIIQRHTTQLLIQQASIGVLVTAMTGTTNQATSYGLETARAFGLMRYSRGIEEEADIGGMQMLLEAGIDPEGMVTFFGTLKEKGPKLPSMLKYLSTHPCADDRIEKLKSLAARNRRDWVPLLKGYDWSDIKNICSNTSHPQPTPIPDPDSRF